MRALSGEQRTPAKVRVREVLANGDERCEVCRPSGADLIDSPVTDWRHVRDVNFQIDPVTGEAVLSFTRNNTSIGECSHVTATGGGELV
jgi:hypothetical protein